MQEWLEALKSGGTTSLLGVAILLALLLWFALFFALPGSQRSRVRLPLVFLALHLALIAIRWKFPGTSGVVWPAALFFLLASIGRSAFLLVVDWLFALRFGRSLPKIIRDLIQAAVYVLVAIPPLHEAGADPGSLLTTSALLTAVIGLSLQETLGNLFAGLAMQAQRPFAVGDWIQFDAEPQHVGRVTEINWRATKVLTNDLVEVIVPNGILAKAPIVNFTQPTRLSRRLVKVQASYEAPPRVVQAALFEAVKDARGVLASPAPLVLVNSFADSGVEYWVHYFIDEFEQRNPIDSEVRARIWYALKRGGISIPFPVRDVRFHDMSVEAKRSLDEERVAARERAMRNVDFLDVLPEEALAELARHVQTRFYTTGEAIIRQGEQGDQLFIILSGEVAVLLGKNGTESEVARLGPGKFFGEMSLMTGEARSATVRAAAECELLVVGHTEFHDVLVTAPELAERVSHVLAKRQAQLEERSSNPSIATGQEVVRSGVLLKKIKEFFSI